MISQDSISAFPLINTWESIMQGRWAWPLIQKKTGEEKAVLF